MTYRSFEYSNKLFCCRQATVTKTVGHVVPTFSIDWT